MAGKTAGGSVQRNIRSNWAVVCLSTVWGTVVTCAGCNPAFSLTQPWQTHSGDLMVEWWWHEISDIRLSFQVHPLLSESVMMSKTSSMTSHASVLPMTARSCYKNIQRALEANFQLASSWFPSQLDHPISPGTAVVIAGLARASPRKAIAHVPRPITSRLIQRNQWFAFCAKSETQRLEKKASFL